MSNDIWPLDLSISLLVHFSCKILKSKKEDKVTKPYWLSKADPLW